MPPLAIIKPNETWQRRALFFSTVVLLIVLVGGYFVPYVLLLAPFVIYRFLYHLRALQGRLRIEIHESKLVYKPVFGRKRALEKSHVKRFVAVCRGDNEVVVARTQDVTVRGEGERELFHPSDVVLPGGLMRNAGLVSRLESWRLGTFSAESLFSAADKKEERAARGAG